jgi:uncharacterized protein (TIGR03435 family)
MKSLHLTLGITLLALATAPQGSLAQSAPTFAVAAIRPSGASVPFEHDGKTDLYPNSLRMQDVTVTTCLKFAYGMQYAQIEGPDWLHDEHFDILAKSEEPVTPAQMKQMMQSLLADRFKLTFHHEQRELNAFALGIAKTGSQLKDAQADSASTIVNSGIGFVATSTAMPEFATYLADPLRVPVIDKTGLKGRYDFAVDFRRFLPSETDGQRVDHTDVTYIVRTAVHDLLGLTLEPQKAQVDVYVIDHIEKPTPN